jgi:hypothetical protein
MPDSSMAERYTAMLRSHTEKNTLDVWRAYADCFDGERLIRCGDRDTGLSLLRPAADELWRAGFVQYHATFVVALMVWTLAGSSTRIASENTGEKSMVIARVGLDSAKNVFQVHGVASDDSIVVRRQLRRHQVLAFFGDLPRCIVGIEACPGAHHCGR